MGLISNKVAPALLAGCTVILKSSPEAPGEGYLIAEAAEAVGLPAGVLNVLTADREVSELLVRDPRVDKITFIAFSAMIVLDDVDLDRAVSAGAWGSFLHQGQICMTTGRHLVHEAVYDEYVARLADKAAHLPVGDPASGQVALGPVIDERQRDKVHALVAGSVEAGARLAAGGSYEGLFYRPTVLADVAPAMPAYASEVFGPVAPVLRFATAEDAAKLAAESEYGLSLGILTRDVMRGLELARQIPTGIVHINEQTVDDEPNVPFGGLLASGTGARFGGTANLDAFTETRWVTVRGDITPYPF
jgi:benzaldehyde dehydrogenase (NAD)